MSRISRRGERLASAARVTAYANTISSQADVGEGPGALALRSLSFPNRRFIVSTPPRKDRLVLLPSCRAHRT
jgi:hypothetical protein